MQKKYALTAVILLILNAVVNSAALRVVSEPAGAEIIINHIRTGKYTPDTIRNLPRSEITVSVLLDDYRYAERTILPTSDTLSTLSFTHLTDFDTLAITGDSLFGILQLPVPPVEAPYLVNEIIEDRENVILSSGIHHIQWDGGISYAPVDTFVEIRSARITSVELKFLRRYGRVSLVTEPDSAALYIDTTLWGIGRLQKPIPAGKHELTVSASGWLTKSRSFLLFPGQTIRDTIRLEISPDRDGDGFYDTVDICPDLHGIYDGCPSIQKREELKRLGNYFSKSFAAAPFTVELAPFLFQYRFATDRSFRELISLFNDGSGLFTNYRGVTLLNKIWVSRGFFIGSVDVGYSFAGLKYEKSWQIPINDDSTHILHYDQYRDENPQLGIFSFGVQGGIQLHSDIISFAFLTGYLYEKIELRGISSISRESGDTTFIDQSDLNSRWNSTVRATVSPWNKPLYPRFYGEMSFAPGTEKVTGWIDTRFGVIVPWWRERN